MKVTSFDTTMYTTFEVIQHCVEDVKKALDIPSSMMPEAPHFLNRGAASLEIGCQIGKVYAIKTEWGKQLFVGYSPEEHTLYSQSTFVPQIYRWWYKDNKISREKSCFPFYCSSKGIQIVQEIGLEKILKALDPLEYIEESETHKREYNYIHYIGSGLEGDVYKVQLAPKAAVAVKRFGNFFFDGVYIDRGDNEQKPSIFRKREGQHTIYNTEYTPLDCFLRSQYLIKKVINAIPKRYCRIRGVEDFFATTELLVSEIGPRLKLSNLIGFFGIEHFSLAYHYSTDQNTRHSIQRFIKKTKINEEFLRKANKDIETIRDIIYMTFNFEFIDVAGGYGFEVSPFNMLVKSYQDDVLDLALIDSGEKNYYVADDDCSKLVKEQLWKRELYEKLICDPFYEEYIRTHFAIEKTDMFAHLGVTEVVKPLFL